MRKLLLTSIALLLMCSEPGLAAADANQPLTGRDEFQQAYKNQLQDTPSIFGSAPVYHIIPTENTITFAGEYRYYDVTVAPPGSDISSNRLGLNERLDLTGWAAAPYVAFQAKEFGFGFTGETGKREVHYLRLPASGQGYEEHLGVEQYSGVGLNVFWTPPQHVLPKFMVPTLIVGTKSLNAVEKTSGELFDQYSTVDTQKYQYSVHNYEVGTNVSLNLVKHFTVIPWVDYSSYYYSTPTSSNGTATPDKTVSQDAELFWRIAPPLTYGIDFAVRLWGLDIHMGGLIGILGTLNKGSDRIQDNSHTISISVDTRGG